MYKHPWFSSAYRSETAALIGAPAPSLASWKQRVLSLVGHCFLQRWPSDSSVFFLCVWTHLACMVLSWDICRLWRPGNCILTCLHQDLKRFQSSCKVKVEYEIESTPAILLTQYPGVKSYWVLNVRLLAVTQSSKWWLSFCKPKWWYIKDGKVTWNKLSAILQNLFVADNYGMALVYIYSCPPL